MLRDLAIPDFLDKLNSSEPTPGGGGCAALNGAIAAGLIQMVCNVTTNKMLKKEQPVDKELVKTVLVAKNYQDELLRLIDLDAEAFGIVINSYKLPKSTDGEKAARVLGISEACKKACKPPLDTLDICVKLLPLARTMEKTLKTENIRMMTITAVTLNFISGRKSPGSFSFILITSNCRILLFFLLL